MQLVGDRDAARFSCEISAVCADPHPTNGRPAYRDVLAWVVDAIVGVLIARLGAAGPGEKFILEFRSPGGGMSTSNPCPRRSVGCCGRCRLPRPESC